MGVSIFAPAKINLSLHVGAPRADGRHPLVSLTGFADVGDLLRMERGAAALTTSGPFATRLEGENLISRALAALGVSAQVNLEKILPVASGIGGGSADAAAALRGADVLLGLSLGETALRTAAAKIGADIPVCVSCQPAIMSGAGEVLAPLALPTLDAVLVNPGCATLTGAVYRRFDEMGLGVGLETPADPGWRSASEAVAGLKAMRNDLEAPALALEPLIGDVLAELKRAPRVLLARMSGSGATCFALMEHAEDARNLAQTLAARHSNWWVRAARIGAVDAAPRPI